MARDVEQGQRRPRERPAASEDDSAYSSSSRGSSDGEGPQGGAASKTAEAASSTSAVTPSTATTFPAAALSRWFASSASAPTPAPAPTTNFKTKISTKLYDSFENTGVAAIRFDDDDDDDDESDVDEEAGGETAASVKRRILGAAAAAAAAAREEEDRRRRSGSHRRRCVIASLLLLFLVASAFAAVISSPWWLSATLLRPPRTRELPFVFIEAPTTTAETTTPMTPSSFVPPPAEIVPRVIHQSWRTHSTPPQWDAARRSCAELHPPERGWSVRLWSDAELREAVAEAALRISGGPENHASRALLAAYDAYPNPVQRADVGRYAVLFLHGGVYLDLDVRCERPLDAPELALLEKEIVLPRTWPAGVSNDVIVAAPGCGLLALALRSAASASKIASFLLFPSGYGKVMFSTGPMFLTLQALRWPQRAEKLWVMPARLYGKYGEKSKSKSKSRGSSSNSVAATSSSPSSSSAAAAGCDGITSKGTRLHGAGAACGALFTHLHGSSWHGKDAELVAWVRGGKGKEARGGGGRGSGAAVVAGVSAAAVAAAVVAVARRVRTKRQEEKQRQELRLIQQQQQLLQMHGRRVPYSLKQKHQRPLGLFGKKKRPLVPTATTSLSKQH